MRFISTPQQRDFFRKNHFIGYEGLLSPEQAAQLHEEVELLTAKRLNTARTQIDHTPSLTLFKAGHDLWRESQIISKLTQKLSIAHIASDLFSTSVLRIGFDQCCLIHPPVSSPFSTALSLEEISCIKPLAGGILFLLENQSHTMSAFPLPKTAGEALFLAPSYPIPWPLLFSQTRLRMLILALAPEKSFYRQEQYDHHSSLLKKWGYVYNDQLQSTLHPIIYGKK